MGKGTQITLHNNVQCWANARTLYYTRVQKYSVQYLEKSGLEMGCGKVRNWWKIMKWSGEHKSREITLAPFVLSGKYSGYTLMRRKMPTCNGRLKTVAPTELPLVQRFSISCYTSAFFVSSGSHGTTDQCNDRGGSSLHLSFSSSRYVVWRGHQKCWELLQWSHRAPLKTTKIITLSNTDKFIFKTRNVGQCPTWWSPCRI